MRDSTCPCVVGSFYVYLPRQKLEVGLDEKQATEEVHDSQYLGDNPSVDTVHYYLQAEPLTELAKMTDSNSIKVILSPYLTFVTFMPQLH